MADKADDSTSFIDFSLDMFQQALSDLLDAIRPEPSIAANRLKKAKGHFTGIHLFRKDYTKLHKTISSSTASRDLNKWVDSNILIKSGKQALAIYSFQNL